jgi:hypothetical protein
MVVTEEAIEEYKQEYYKEHGVELSDEEARKQATELLELMKAIYKPAKKSWIKEGWPDINIDKSQIIDRSK